MNKVILQGRLTRDPDVKQTDGGMLVCRFSVAVDRTYADRNGERGADFPNVVCFGKTAELAQKYFCKGKPVLVEGRIQTGSYQNKDGNTVYTTDVVAERLEFVLADKTRESSSNSGGNNGGYAGYVPEFGFADGQGMTSDDLPF